MLTWVFSGPQGGGMNLKTDLHRSGMPDFFFASQAQRSGVQPHANLEPRLKVKAPGDPWEVEGAEPLPKKVSFNDSNLLRLESGANRASPLTAFYVFESFALISCPLIPGLCSRQELLGLPGPVASRLASSGGARREERRLRLAQV